MSGLRTSNEVILAKIETTYNTDPTPSAGTNAILVRNLNYSTAGLRMIDRGAIRASLGDLQKIYGGELRKVSFQVEVKGSGTAGTAPEIGPLLQAAGLLETIVAVTSATYTPNSGGTTAHKSITIYFYEGGRKLHILTGCRGTVKFGLDAGGLMLMDFEFTGHLTQPTDASQPSPTYNAQVPKAGLNMSVSFNGISTLVPRKWSIDLGWKLAMPPSLAAVDGYGQIILVDRSVTGSLEIESELDSIIDIDALLQAGTRFAFSAGTLGGTAGNRVALSTPSSSTYITDSVLAEGDGIRLRTVPFAVDDSTSDTEISLAFT
jgi:hypothetical protein